MTSSPVSTTSRRASEVLPQLLSRAEDANLHVELRECLLRGSAQEAQLVARSVLKRVYPDEYAYALALTILLQCEALTDVATLRDLALAKIRCTSRSFDDIEVAVIHSFLLGRRHGATPQKGDVATLWGTGDDRYTSKLRQIIISATPPRNASWFSEWFGVVVQEIFADQKLRASHSDSFAKYLAAPHPERNLKSRRLSADRYRLAQAMLRDWSGTLDSLDETITNLLIERLRAYPATVSRLS